MSSLQIFRSAIYHCLGDPALDDSSDKESAFEYFEDGILMIENGLISRIGPADELLKELPSDVPITHFTDKLIIPGLIDSTRIIHKQILLHPMANNCWTG